MSALNDVNTCLKTGNHLNYLNLKHFFWTRALSSEESHFFLFHEQILILVCFSLISICVCFHYSDIHVFAFIIQTYMHLLSSFRHTGVCFHYSDIQVFAFIIQAYMTFFEVTEDGCINGQISKHINPSAAATLVQELSAQTGDIVFISAGQDYIPVSIYSYLDQEKANYCSVDKFMEISVLHSFYIKLICN